MTITPVAPTTNFNLAVETLRKTLRQDKVAAEVLSRAQEEVKFVIDEKDHGKELGLGRNLSTHA